ncbi:MAG: phosphoribosylamine--glycine ligase [Deltaproteobacteria bacterium]|nr:MAG: phosphoribosylamine--glycine ligase [Deltaproteobacteria bacterium]
MRVLVIGSGGREHALVWKLRRSPRVQALYCAPGNAGIAADAECVPIAADDLPGLERFAREAAIDLTVVGPELPLTLGLVDRFAAAGLRAFGPTAAAARLEGSKAFTKELCHQHHVPSAAFGVFRDPADATAYIREVGAPVVVKADGLASGKGVFICPTVAEATRAVDELMRGRVFGDAGTQVVVEEFLEGEEVSFMALVGVLYAGLMVQGDRAKLLEFNVRFGDPEAQVLLVRLRSDLVDLLERATAGRLAGASVDWDPRAAVCVVLAAEGYPGAVERGRPIAGVDEVTEAVVFHAGTRRRDGVLVTDGGRVLGVTALGDTTRAAVEAAYGAAACIRWPGMHYRRDIGHRALARGAA